MNCEEYLKAAEKHLKYCLKWRDRVSADTDSGKQTWDETDLLEIYYLSGYIAECLIIYITYYAGGWWPEPTNPRETRRKNQWNKAKQCDIELYFDPIFTHHTQFDFYAHSTDKEKRHVHRLIKSVYNQSDKPVVNCKDEYSTKIDGEDKWYVWKKSDSPKSIKTSQRLEDCMVGTDIGKGGLIASFCVQQHKFMDTFQHVLKSKLISSYSLNDIKVFSSAFQDTDSFKLMKEWRTSLRYMSSIKQWEESSQSITQNLINEDNLASLIEDLDKFYQEIKSKI